MNEKKLKRTFLIGYTLIILFCMFIGFGRIERFDTFHYSFILHRIPLWIPKQGGFDLLRIWIFSLGNLVAFIPFGFLIPWNLQPTSKCFGKSFVLFLISITVLEVLQMVSRLGSFDVADILINTVGFLIGAVSYALSQNGKDFFRRVMRFCLACLILVALTLILAGGINSFLR